MNKASEGVGIPVELFQILKDDAMKMLHSICHVRKVLGQGGLGGEVEGKAGRKGTLRENHGEHLENLTPAPGIWKV